MINNYLIPPHPALKLFIDNYILSTSNGRIVTFKTLWPATNETSFIFHLSDPPQHFLSESNRTVSLANKPNCITGLLSNFNGIISYSGNYHRFIIQFKPGGFYKIFRRPFSEFANQIVGLDDVFGTPVNHLHDELSNTTDFQKMAYYTDTFLLSFLNKQSRFNKNMHDGITTISRQLLNCTSSNIAYYANKANMSIRNFERRFNYQIGTSPKLYFRLARFNNAVVTKLECPEKNWTSIAYECGYYDQMHMIKDFKKFANINPSNFIQSKDFIRPRIDITGYDYNAFCQLNANLSYEKFIPVNRHAF